MISDSEKITLDFTGLFSDSAEDPAPAEKNASEDVETIAPEKISELKQKIQDLNDKLITAEEIIFNIQKKRAEDILKSDQLRVEINKGIATAEDPNKLLLKSLEAISILLESEAIFKTSQKILEERINK